MSTFTESTRFEELNHAASGCHATSDHDREVPEVDLLSDGRLLVPEQANPDWLTGDLL